MKKQFQILLFCVLLPPHSGIAQITTLFDTIDSEIDTSKVKEILTSTGMMKDGFRVGVWQSWYSNKQLADSGAYAIIPKNKIKIHDDDSTFSEVDTNYIRNSFKENYSFQVGKWVSYYKNGKIKSTGSYLPNGIVKVFVVAIDDGMGEIKDVSYFSYPEEMKTGIWKNFDKNGKIEEEENYIHGVFVGDIPVE